MLLPRGPDSGRARGARARAPCAPHFAASVRSGFEAAGHNSVPQQSISRACRLQGAADRGMAKHAPRSGPGRPGRLHRAFASRPKPARFKRSSTPASQLPRTCIAEENFPRLHSPRACARFVAWPARGCARGTRASVRLMGACRLRRPLRSATASSPVRCAAALGGAVGRLAMSPPASRSNRVYYYSLGRGAADVAERGRARSRRARKSACEKRLRTVTGDTEPLAAHGCSTQQPRDWLRLPASCLVVGSCGASPQLVRRAGGH